MDKLYNNIFLGITFFEQHKKGRAIHYIFLVFNNLKPKRMPFLSLMQPPIKTFISIKKS